MYGDDAHDLPPVEAIAAELEAIGEAYLRAADLPRERAREPIFVFVPRIDACFSALVEHANRGQEDFSRVDAVLDRFIERAKERVGIPFLAPMPPFGIHRRLAAWRADLRYAVAKRGHVGACDCALIVEHARERGPSRESLVKTGASDDICDTYEDYQCRACGRRWRLQDCSTEQYSHWAWLYVGRG